MLWRLRQTVGCWIKGESTGERVTPPGEKNLGGDRQVEWSYVISRMAAPVEGKNHALDFGCGSGMLSIAARSLGYDVTSIDLLPKEFVLADDQIHLLQCDVMDLPEDKLFDLIMHASVIEHVGLSGRYMEADSVGKDVEAMRKLHRLLAPGGVMIMTLPIGVDKVVPPYHRIYGEERLPQLIEGFSVEEECFWRKSLDNLWRSCCRDEACQEEGNERYYALGGFVLKGQ